MVPVGNLTLRPYAAADEDAAIELWRRTWAHHFPHIDFNARVAWWRERWRQELIPERFMGRGHGESSSGRDRES